MSTGGPSRTIKNCQKLTGTGVIISGERKQFIGKSCLAYIQIRGLVELEKKREAEGYLCNSITGSPLKQVNQQINGLEVNDGASTTSSDLASRGEDFSIDEVRSRLHGQLDIQPIASEKRVVPPPPGPGVHHPLPSWFTSSRPTESDHAPPTTTGPKLALATSSNDSEGHHSEDDVVSFELLPLEKCHAYTYF